MAEIRAKSGNQGDEQFVVSLYRALFDREPDDPGLHSNLKALQEGMQRHELLNAFLSSEEYRAQIAHRLPIDPSIIYNLCPFPIWCMDLVTVEPDQPIVASGWAVAHPDYLAIGEIALNGRKPDRFHWSAAPDIVQVLPWFQNQASRFSASFENRELSAKTDLKFSLVRGLTHEPFNRWQDVYFPLRTWITKSYMAPNAASMARTQGNDSLFQYVLLGATVAHMLDEVVRTYFGKEMAEFDSICDWGCGCARVIQALHRMAPKARITGLDIDGDNIQWCQRSLPYGRFLQVPHQPPTAIPEGEFDLL
jgi:hypothetical protein